ncbi:MAG: hypothetical protein WCW01_02305 [Gammaproteobacteria bacterium]
MKSIRYVIIIFFLMGFSTSLFAANAPAKLLPSVDAVLIGMKIWKNECGGSILGLTSWNSGEDFASLGIGHFLWYPEHSSGRSNQDSFPQLIVFMQENNFDIPGWIKSAAAIGCPWHSREEFMHAENDPRMRELRLFLSRNIVAQVDFMVYRFALMLPKILQAAPAPKRPVIAKRLYEIMQTPQGVYALIDYLNFKGDGILAEHSKQARPSWGLLQVLENMDHAPSNLSPQEAYIWSARAVLERRVLYAASSQHEEKWLAGWLKRVDGYR